MYHLFKGHEPECFPWMNHILIGAILGGFAYELGLGPAVRNLVQSYGWIPAPFALGVQRGEIHLTWSILISLFLHGGWAHLLGNLLVLFVLGNIVEERFGAFCYLVLYFAGGLVAVLAQTAATPLSYVPMIGSSGAVAAVCGAYCVLSVRRVRLDLFETGINPSIQKAAFFFLVCGGIFWYSGTLPEDYLQAGMYFSALLGNAWAAHVGGFIGGIFLTLIIFALESDARLRSLRSDTVFSLGNPKPFPR